MPTDNTTVANLALLKLSIAKITNIDDAADDTSIKCKLLLPLCRQKVVTDLAAQDAPFKETLKYADLGIDLKANDLQIDTITVGATPTFTVTVTTTDNHNRTTGSKVFLSEIKGTGGIVALNSQRYTLTDTGDKTFTIDNLIGSALWVHTQGSGEVSDIPDTGSYRHAFNLPTDCFMILGQTKQSD